jgi:hypothetical protein
MHLSGKSSLVLTLGLLLSLGVVCTPSALALQGVTPAAVAPGAKMMPALNISSPFGWRTDPINGQQRFHAGIDLPSPSGTPVLAAQSGYVVFSGLYGDYGQAVVMDHGSSLFTLYGHNSERLVTAGQYIQAGQPIARVGATGRVTGPHLHFEVHYNKQYLNPADYIGSYFKVPLGPADMLPPVIASKPSAATVATRVPVPQARRTAHTPTTIAYAQGGPQRASDEEDHGLLYGLFHRKPKVVRHVDPNEKTIPLSWDTNGPSSVIGWKDNANAPPTPGRRRVEMVTGNQMETVEF